MGIITNRITAGDYKDADLKVKFGKKVVIVKHGLFANREIELNKKTVERIELIDKSKTIFDFAGMKTAQVGIYFKGGKKSLAVMDSAMYRILNEVMF